MVLCARIRGRALPRSVERTARGDNREAIELYERTGLERVPAITMMLTGDGLAELTSP